MGFYLFFMIRADCDIIDSNEFLRINKGEYI